MLGNTSRHRGVTDWIRCLILPTVADESQGPGHRVALRVGVSTSGLPTTRQRPVRTGDCECNGDFTPSIRRIGKNAMSVEPTTRELQTSTHGSPVLIK